MGITSGFLTRHAFGWGATLVAMLAAPYVAGELSWGLSGLLDGSGGMHLYALGWGGSHAALDDRHMVVDALSPALFIIPCAVSALCVAGELGRRRFPWLSWSLPILPAVPLGLWAAALTSRDGLPSDLPAYVPLVTGLTFAIIVAMLVTAYWGAVLLSARMTSRPAQQ